MATALSRFAGPLLALSCMPLAAQVDTMQSASSSVEAQGATQVDDRDTASNGAASSQALWSGNTNNHARTAARSRSSEIAANARVFQETGFNFVDYDLAISQANYTISATGALAPRQASFDFFLPPSYLEIVSNAETYFHQLNATLLAELRVCFATSCSLGDRHLYVQADLDATYREHNVSVQASGNPALDLSPFLNATISDSGIGGFTRTRLIEFPAFSGHLDLGHVPAGVPITVDYVLQTRAWGTVAFSSAIAAINDPFFLDSDPITGGVPLVLTLAPVPEPPAVALMLLGGLLLVLRKRPSRWHAATHAIDSCHRTASAQDNRWPIRSS